MKLICLSSQLQRVPCVIPVAGIQTGVRSVPRWLLVCSTAAAARMGQSFSPVLSWGGFSEMGVTEHPVHFSITQWGGTAVLKGSVGLGCGSWGWGWLQGYPANAPREAFFLLTQTSPRPGAVGRSCVLLTASFFALLGQQQSGGGHGEGREPACHQRRLLCILGERHQTSEWALWECRNRHPGQSVTRPGL